MQDFDYDGFYDNLDTLDDGMDHGDEYAVGFQPFDPEQQNNDGE